MKKNMLISLMIIGVLLLIACESEVGYPPPSKVESSTEQQPETSKISSAEPKTETKETQPVVKCTDECTSSGCDGSNYIACNTDSNGCKLKQDNGATIGKCDVECKIDSDCGDSESCNEYRCKETIFSINQDIDVDYLKYKVTKVQTFTKMGTSMFKKETAGKFIKVYLSITNNAKETKQILTPRFKLIDSQDRKFDRLSDDSLYIADVLEFGKQLQPGLAVSGAIVFEMPKDSENIKLLISGDWLSLTEVMIELSDIQDIGTDTTQKDEQDEMMDELMSDAESQVEELMNQCNSPFVCTSSCQEFMDVGQKDCSSGQVCCMQT
jgi:hypothetical protein